MIVSNLILSEDTENELFRIHDGSFPFPDLSDSLYISKKIAIADGRVIGCGLVRLTSEFTLLLDKSIPLKDRVLAVEEMQKQIICELRKKGIKDVHSFVNDERVLKFAEHLGFRECPEKYSICMRFGY